MIHPILGYISIYLILGGIGMYFANRKVDEDTRRQRWIKYGVYILIIGGIIGSILVSKFFFLASSIVAIGLFEVIKVVCAASKTKMFVSTTVFIYSSIAIGSILFSIRSSQSFLLFIIFQVFTFDGFSQISGQLFGRNQLIPQISPGKTIEGSIGGTIFCLISAFLAKGWVSLSIVEALIFGLITVVSAFTGDILASYLKRCCDIKDYSNLLPGHGGFLDRFDSLLMTGMGYTCLLWNLR